jgi:uncharacterized protein related to proFAR isomerase
MNLEPKTIKKIETNINRNDLEIIPAVSLFKGIPVIRKEASYEPLQDINEENITIHELLDELKKHYKKALITDINGINKDRPQLELLKTISTKMELWVDAGSRYGEGAIDILITGAEKVVLGTKTLRSLEELENAVELSENVVLGIDWDDTIVSPEKSIKEMLPSSLTDKARSLGIKDVIFTDLRHLSLNTDFDLDAGSPITGMEMNVYLHGRFEGNMERLRGMGFKGIVIEVEMLI